MKDELILITENPIAATVPFHQSVIILFLIGECVYSGAGDSVLNGCIRCIIVVSNYIMFLSVISINIA